MDAISVVDPPVIPLAIVRTRAAPGAFAALIRTSPVWPFLKERGIPSGGHTVVVYRTAPGGLMDVDVGADVLEPFAEEAPPIVNGSTPAGPAASMVHRGPYEHLRDAHQTVVDWCAEHRWHRTGVLWEVYGHWTADPDALETTLFHQVRPRPM